MVPGLTSDGASGGTARRRPGLTPAGLPGSIAGLRQLIQLGDLSPATALQMQRQAFLEQDVWHCVVQVLNVPGSEPDIASTLAGVGVAHKDIFVFPGRSPACGVDGPPSGWKPTGESTVVRRLTKKGAPPLASLAMAPYACGATAENDSALAMINPIDPDAAVGGSSSGSAVAVAAGLCYAALGTDTAGSVRIPAATCGVLGLMPGAGCLPTQGTAPLAPSLDTVGLLARSAADLVEVFSATLAAHQSRMLQQNMDRAATKGLRVGACWVHADPATELAADVVQVLSLLAEDLNAVARQIPQLGELRRLAEVVLYAEAAQTHADALRAGVGMPRMARHLALAGAAVPVTWYQDAIRRQRALQTEFLATVMGDLDVLLVPALAQGVPDAALVTTSSARFEPRKLLDMFAWMSFVNYLGLPAITIPIALDARGRPTCVQAIARPCKEGFLLALAQQLETARA